MIRERIATAYPGIQAVGLSLWVVDDRELVAVAVGSAEHAQVAEFFRRFHPDVLIVEGSRTDGPLAAPFRAEAERLVFAHPAWRQRSRRQPLGRVGPLAQNAWRMGWHELFTRRPYRVGLIRPEPLDQWWLHAWARRQRG